MKRFGVIAVGLLCLSFSALAQKDINLSTSQESPAHAPETPDPSTREQRAYARKLLEIAEGEAAGFRGGMRAFADLQLARAYIGRSRKKALHFLTSAFVATREMDDDQLSTREGLQVEILNVMATVSPAKTEEYLLQVGPERRAEVLQSLLRHYEENAQLDHAVQILYRVANEAEFPYRAAKPIMAALPKDDSGELARLFTTALASYRQHAERKQPRHPTDDLTVLVQEFAAQLPPELVKDAIAEILKQAGPERKKEFGDMQLSLSSSAGAAAFSSEYQYKLFLLLPILREVDEDEAEALSKKNAEAAAWIAKYQKGLPSDARLAVTYGGTGNAGAGWLSQEAQEYTAEQKVIADAEKHPEQALAAVAGLRGKLRQAQALLGIAQGVWKKNPTLARAALKQLLDVAQDLDVESRVSLLPHAADTFLKMKSGDDAKAVVKSQLSAAAKMLEIDTNADDPNMALKAYWPSTHAYVSAFEVAGRISPAWATTLLSEFTDAETRFCAEMALASRSLNFGTGASLIVSSNKSGHSVGRKETY